MSLHQWYSQFGLGDADQAIVRDAEREFDRLGLSRQQRAHVYEWVQRGGYDASKDIDTNWQNFANSMHARGLPSESIRNIGKYHDRVIVQGLQHPAPTPQESAAKVAELEKLMKEDPDSYFGDLEKQLALHDALDSQQEAEADFSPETLVDAEWNAETAKLEAEKTGAKMFGYTEEQKWNARLSDVHSDYYEGPNSAELRAAYESYLDDQLGTAEPKGYEPSPTAEPQRVSRGMPQSEAPASEAPKPSEQQATQWGGLDSLELSEPTATANTEGN